MKGIKLVPNKPLTELQKLKVDNTMLRQEVASLKKKLKLYGVSQCNELLVCDCKNTCDELTDVGEKVFKCKGLPK